MTDRAAILGAIASASRASGISPEEIANEALALVADPSRVQPDFAEHSLLERFVAKATSERVTATVEMVDRLSDVPNAVAGYLQSNAQSGPLAVQEHAELASLDWSNMDRTPTLANDGGSALTYAEYAIAETGSVVFRSGPDSPILLNFLPLYHLVVLKAELILGYPEELWPKMGGPETAQTRLLTIVTGKRGTAAIEAKNVRGAHGPRYMHILIVL